MSSTIQNLNINEISITTDLTYNYRDKMLYIGFLKYNVTVHWD